MRIKRGDSGNYHQLKSVIRIHKLLNIWGRYNSNGFWILATLPEEAGEIDEPDEHHAVADIDEMNAATMRENLLTQKNRLRTT